MKIKVSISFPCTQAEWVKLSQIRALAGNVLVAVPAKTTKNPSTEAMTEEMDEGQKALLDTAMEKAHAQEVTPMMDSGSICLSEELRKMVANSPGEYTVNELASFMVKLYPQTVKAQWYRLAYTLSSPSAASKCFERHNGKLSPIHG